MISSNPFSPHKDVLDAPIPLDSISKTVLLNEVKNRAKGAVQAGQWPDAKCLYEKAVEIAVDNKAECAICHSNLSLVLGKMNMWSEAKQAAQTATTEDATYVKGFWRLGSAHAALKEYSDALRALEAAKKLEPDNKALLKEMERVRQQQLQQPAVPAPAVAPKPPKTTPVPPRSALSGNSSTKTSSSTGSSTSSSKPSEKATAEHDATDVDFSKSDITRGYKIVNGKKTSYFHNELDEHTKQLIGDIAPKKLDSTSAAPTAAAAANSDVIGSVWNQAGTWEEKEISKWACETLQSMLETTSYESEIGHASVSKAEVTGSASVAMVRGKKRYIYELAVSIEWKVGGSQGKINFPDVDGTCMVGEAYDAAGFQIDATDPAHDANTLHNIVFKRGLRDELHKSIDGWVEHLKETY
jgi:tetratricopeptide (TPR) repeat protein